MKKLYPKLIVSLLIVFMVTVRLFAQGQGSIIRGRVLDENNEPLPGVAVIAGGTSSGATTDVDGEFTLRLPAKFDGTIIIQTMGYLEQEVPVGNRSTFEIKLSPDALNIEEAVVQAGYGSVRKSDVTGSLTSVKVDELTAARAMSFDQILSGRAAGVQVTSANAAPGGAVKIRVRGSSSLRGDNAPLYVVDGSILQTDDISDPLSSYGANKGNATQDTQNPLSLINPQDIESIEVLKDASATAIYGSQGANGVVLITTKQNTTGFLNVNYNGTFTISTLPKKYDLLSLEEYADFRNALYTLNGNTEDFFDATAYAPVDWQNVMFKPSFSKVHRVSINGRDKGTSYYIAGGVSDQNGLVKSTGFDQQDFRLNITQTLNDRLKLISNTVMVRQENNMTTGASLTGNASMIYQILAHGPFSGDYNPNGVFDENSVLESPTTWLNNYDDNTVEFHLNTANTIDAKITEWLTWSNKLTLDYRNSTRMRWYGTATYQGQLANGQASMAQMNSLLYNIESLLQIRKKQGDHNITGTAGIVYNDKLTKNNGAVGEDFANFLLRADGISAAQLYYPITYNVTEVEMFSALARAIWSYKDRYVLTATFRADGSSKFQKENKFAYFPSLAAAWRVTEEPFFSSVDWVSNLKLRASWGQVGNQSVTAYQTLPLYNKTTYSAPGNTGIITGYMPSGIANPLLKWETSEQTNLGIDLGLFNSRLNITAEAYVKNTRDLLQQFSIPISTGYDKMWLNRGVIQNKGFEVTADATLIRTRNFQWTVSGNISVNRNRIVSLGMEKMNIGALKDVVGYTGNNVGSGSYVQAPGNIFLEGEPIGRFFGYETAGIMTQDMYDSQNPAERIKLNGTEIIPGDVLYVDQTGDHNVTPDDRVLIGDPNPDFTYGFQTGFAYKGFTFDLSFNGSHGADLINATRARLEDVATASNHLRAAIVEAWTPTNEDTYYPRIGYAVTNNLTDRLIEDASFLRLDAVSLGYHMDLRKYNAFVKSVTMNASIGNAYVWTNYSGFDPEVDSYANNPNRIGIDMNSYPRARNFVFGVSVSF